MPVSETPLCGEKVAVRWAGHDPRAADLRFHRLAHAANLDEAIAVLDDAHGVALNVLVADRARMAHLATGLLPRRPAGAACTDPADGHLTGAERPRLVDPADGVLVSANDAALPEDEFRIGLDLDPGHRARRIRAVLTGTERPDAAGMTALQHDIAAELYLPYRDLAVAALRPADPTRSLLEQWDGTAATDSRAFGVLVRLRDVLAQRVLAPYLAVCREHDPAFRFPFRDLDRPLLAILHARDRALLPAGTTDVDGFIADCVTAALRERQEKWGRLNRVGLGHPLAALAPWANALLGIRPRPQAGMLHSVRTAVAGFGAAGRVVLTAGDLVTAELPAGQSGHPLSPHYADRHARWASLPPFRSRARRDGCDHVLRPPGR
jgi:penicillin amidase